MMIPSRRACTSTGSGCLITPVNLRYGRSRRRASVAGQTFFARRPRECNRRPPMTGSWQTDLICCGLLEAVERGGCALHLLPAGEGGRRPDEGTAHPIIPFFGREA